ncbi:outer membrane beta-barrel protein [Cellulophaga sp. L1A9]|uniref:outer membrane beta-barrel protein n=1 Tax=Cellulophaga sp. L1A9 TaxID=2686362 RepID=UPI00131BDB83|nr:outer membrane beta-barrel protein [Cellulophaga sp. L1A9]
MKSLQIIFTTVLFNIVCITGVQAQLQGTSELSLGYGSNSIYKISKFYDISVSSDFSSLLYSEIKSSGVASLSYKYAINNRFMIGGSVNYENLKINKIEYVGFLDFQQIPEQNYSNFSIALETDYRYISNPKFQMYSGLGIAYFSSEAFESNTSFQINALGFRVGKKLAAFAELGFGYKGFLALGASLQF